ncbi:hypothetical protein DSO57_1030137 [Entomophthora muscae]|uniref:Uncharacterized protein n=1 Tax=Entomophthora muscae TaxID=34485 RepID=A0ACC2S2V1_9FUNG|nr:hypothetical protein DSO57_1030137 [Entomophthora muscae]
MLLNTPKSYSIPLPKSEELYRFANHQLQKFLSRGNISNPDLSSLQPDPNDPNQLHSIIDLRIPATGLVTVPYFELGKPAGQAGTEEGFVTTCRLL